MHVQSELNEHGTIAMVLTNGQEKYLLTNEHVLGDMSTNGGKVTQPGVMDYGRIAGVLFPSMSVSTSLIRG
jgi:hypothetical protein